MKFIYFAVLGLSYFGTVKGATVFESVDGKVCHRADVPPADQCCQPYIDLACRSIYVDTTGDVAVSKASCNGKFACLDLGQHGGSATVGEASCNGENACYASGIHVGHIEVGASSCNGSTVRDPGSARNCEQAGSNGGYAKIGDNSCAGPRAYAACFSGGEGGHVEIGDNSCTVPDNGQNCNRIAMNGRVTVGDGSCVGSDPCYEVGYNSLHEVVIGNGSCQGNNACRAVGANAQNAGKTEIGSGSCNCDECCRCLTDLQIQRVPDGKCNEMGNGPNACCESDGSSNANFVNTGTLTTLATDSSGSSQQLSSPGSGPWAAAPTYDIDFTECTFVFDAAAANVGDLTCTYTSSGGTDFYSTFCVGDTLANAKTGGQCDTATGVRLSDGGVSGGLITGTVGDTSPEITVRVSNDAIDGTNTIEFYLVGKVKGSDGNTYKWDGQKVELSMQLDGTFETSSITTTGFNGLDAVSETEQAVYTVSAKRCDASRNDASNTAFELGDNFFLCVDTAQENVKIESISTLLVAKTNTNPQDPAVADFNLIQNNVADNPTNTFIYGANSDNVVIATRFPSRFFDSAGSVKLEGTAILAFQDRRRRLVRIMQETSAAEADFSMEVDIVGSPGFVAAGASAIKVTSFTVLLGALAAGLFV